MAWTSMSREHPTELPQILPTIPNISPSYTLLYYWPLRGWGKQKPTGLHCPGSLTGLVEGDPDAWKWTEAIGCVCMVPVGLVAMWPKTIVDAQGNDSKLWLWKISSRASTSCCKKLIWSEVMNYSMRNHHILILFTCWCAFKDPWFEALLSLLFSRPINADLLSSTSPRGWHLKGIDLLVSDRPNYSGTAKGKELCRCK